MNKFVKVERLSTEELVTCYATMRAGNTRLKALAKIAGMANGKFRAAFFRGLDTKNWAAEDVAFLLESTPAIQAVRDIEAKIIGQYFRLCVRQANRWARNSGKDKDDCLQEALIGLLDAIYNYTDEGTKFVTYAFTCIRNQMINFVQGHLSTAAVQLLQRCNKVRATLHRHVTEEEVFDLAGLTAKDRQILAEANVKVFGQGQLDRKQKDQDWDTPNDYTDFRAGIDHEKDTVPCYYEVYEALNRANLSPLERQLVETSMCPYYGWQTEIARTNVSPETKQPYTRARIGQIYQYALLKFKRAYTREEAA